MIERIKALQLKKRAKNKWFWMAILSALGMLSQALGLIDLPDNWEEILTTTLTALVGLGIFSDPTTPGLLDPEE